MNEEKTITVTETELMSLLLTAAEAFANHNGEKNAAVQVLLSMFALQFARDTFDGNVAQ